MFTGIITDIGVIQKKEHTGREVLMTIQAPVLLPELKHGDSIAVNGVCLTVDKIFATAFKAAVIPETVERTNLGSLRVSSRVNLELPLKVNGRFDGHFVTGHVDGIGTVLKKSPTKQGTTLSILFPPDLAKFFSLKGSIAINGVSLTIMQLTGDFLSVGLIPITEKETNLGSLRENDIVNIEVDLIARYLDRLVQKKSQETDFEWLRERSLI
ncbi:MAG: riboflavin synthase [Patescibacteria group bacterium]